METKEVKKENKPAIVDKAITDEVLTKVQKYKDAGALHLPENYSAENALKSAYLILQETVDKDGKQALQTCTKNSVANALFDMVIQGLSPVKKQCYFIPYGDKLQLSVSYQGHIAIAKRHGLKDITAQVIYEKDVFKYNVDPATGKNKVIEHTQAIENIDINKIKGVYAVMLFEDGTTDTEIMTIQQVKQSWLMGAAKGNSKAHNNFTDEMAKKSVYSRACKGIINRSDDSNIEFPEREENTIKTESEQLPEHKETFSFDDAQVLDDEQQQAEQAKKPKTESKESVKSNPGF